MATNRRIFASLAPLAACAFLIAGNAGATSVTGSETVFGNITGFSSGTSSSTSAAQFNAATATVICPNGYTCGPAVLYEIDFSLTTPLAGSVTVANSSSTQTGYYASATGFPGTYNGSPTAGGPNTTGTSVQQTVGVTLSDPLNSDLIDTAPVVDIPTSNQYKKTGGSPTGGCGGTGSASSSNFINCLVVPTSSSTNYSGTGTDTEGSTYSTGDAGWATESTPYSGPGTVSFGLAAAAPGTTNGTATGNGLSVGTNTASITSLTDALSVTYDYTYTETLIPTSAPEPTTMLLMGGALLGLGLVRRKTRSKTN